MGTKLFPSAVLIALAFCDVAKAEDGEVLVEGPRVLVRSTIPYRRVAERCKEAVEAALPLVEASIPYRLPADEKIVINLFQSKNEYAEAVRKVGGEAFVENQAFTAFASKECYLVVQPRAEPAYLELVGGLPEVTEFLLLHETVHQLIYRSGASNYEFWPDWYSEGMADALAEQCMAKSRKSKDSPMMLEHGKTLVQGLLEKQGDLDLGVLLDLTTLSGGVSRNEIYSTFVSFHRFLASDSKKMKALHDGIGRLGGPGAPGAGMPDDRQKRHGKACAKVLEDVFGPLKPLQSRWTQEVKKQTASWYENFRSSQRMGEEILCAAFPDSNCMLFSEIPAGKGDFALEGELNIPGIGNKQADLYLDVQRKGEFRFLKIGIGARQKGFMTLIPFSQGDWQSKLNVNVDVPVEFFDPAAWIPFRLAVKGKMVKLELAKKHVLEFQVPAGFGGTMSHWGIGTTKGVARFRKIKTGK